MIFLICPIRNATPVETRQIAEYVARLERAGEVVHWPARDTSQEGRGVTICDENLSAIRRASEVHVWWKPGSEGSVFDLGASMALGKPIRIANRVTPTEGKSFSNVLLAAGARRSDGGDRG